MDKSLLAGYLIGAGLNQFSPTLSCVCFIGAGIYMSNVINSESIVNIVIFYHKIKSETSEKLKEMQNQIKQDLKSE